MKKKPKHSMEKAFWLKNLFLIACLLFTATPGFSQNKTDRKSTRLNSSHRT